MRPTPEAVLVSLSRNGISWRATWRADVEGNNEKSRAQRQQTMAEVRKSADTGSGAIRVTPSQ